MGQIPAMQALTTHSLTHSQGREHQQAMAKKNKYVSQAVPA